jgi:hypothetical protein
MAGATPLRVIIVKPSKYDVNGFVERFRWGFMPNSTAPYLSRDLRYGPMAAPVAASTEPAVPSASSSTLPNTSTAVIPVNRRVCATRCLRV